MLRALIFDVDGTLAETEDLHRQAFNCAFAELDLPWRWDPALYADLLTVMGGKERLAHYIDTQHPADAKALHARAPEIHARKTAAYGALVVESRLPLRPGIARLIAEARAAGIRLAVATTTSRPNVDQLLAINFPPGDAPFDVIAAGDEANRKKPAPDVFLLALAGLEIAAAEAVAFEDSAAGSARPAPPACRSWRPAAATPRATGSMAPSRRSRISASPGGRTAISRAWNGPAASWTSQASSGGTRPWRVEAWHPRRRPGGR